MKVTPVHLLTFSALFALVSCNSEDTARLTSENEDLTDKNKSLKALNTQLEEEQQELTDQIDQQLKDVGKMRQELRKAQEQERKTKDEFLEYKEKYKVSVRTKAKGRKLPQLATIFGKKYVNVVFTQVNPAAIRIRHDSGVAVLPFQDLDEKYQKEYYYEEGEAQDYTLAIEQAYLASIGEITGDKEPALPPPGTGPSPWDDKRRDIFSKAKDITLDKHPRHREIAKLEKDIEKLEDEINEIDGRIVKSLGGSSSSASQATQRAGNVSSLERKAEKIVDRLEKLREKLHRVRYGKNFYK